MGSVGAWNAMSSSLGPVWAGSTGVELDLLAFAQLIECGVVDGTTVEEDILTTIRGLDEAEPSVTNEPGYGSGRHVCSSLERTWTPVGVLRTRF